MLELVRTGSVSEGDWLYADRQTAGRGRLGREWVSPVGNLYASNLVSLRPSDPAAPTLALVAAVSVYDTLKIWAPSESLMIKWPNDLLVDGAKISGILLEGVGSAVVVGIGVNLMAVPADLDRAATSLSTLGITPPATRPFLEALTDIFAAWLSRWRAEGISTIRTAWLDRAHPVGTALSAALDSDQRVEGLFDGLTGDCALRLRLADGSTRVIHAGDIFLI
jgi:BirA family biotin operon repressor/biotin-[acetyl-CoA-carboxylase] ligase